jgi:acyl carrier protein
MFDRVKTIIESYVKRDDIEITPETDLLGDLGMNSLELVELVCIFETEFDMDIPEKDIRRFMTVHDVTEYLEAAGA